MTVKVTPIRASRFIIKGIGRLDLGAVLADCRIRVGCISTRLADHKFKQFNSFSRSQSLQLIDSFIVLFIAFYLLASPETRWPISQLFAVGIVGYLYKFIIAVALTPILYLAHYVIDAYLGKELSEKLMAEAAASSVN